MAAITEVEGGGVEGGGLVEQPRRQKPVKHVIKSSLLKHRDEQTDPGSAPMLRWLGQSVFILYIFIHEPALKPFLLIYSVSVAAGLVRQLAVVGSFAASSDLKSPWLPLLAWRRWPVIGSGVTQGGAAAPSWATEVLHPVVDLLGHLTRRRAVMMSHIT